MAEQHAVKVTINGREIEARSGELIIEAAERAGSYVPRFCYHPRMEPVGVCRMCLVEVDGPRGATLQPACYLPVSDGMVVNTETDKVKKAQDGVLEFLLANHPLDCPVCDKGGECPLQDQTLAHGSGETRFIEEKRHFAKPISIGELVLLDRERCIQCSRCTRFAAEVAGDAEIDFAGRGDNIEVAPFPSEAFDSVFSGNTVQICPVGALTAKPYRFTARPWDLEQVESSCETCAVQCRIAVQSSGGRLTRVLGVDSDAVNHGWLCDKGRFAIEAVDAEDTSNDPLDPTGRISVPLVRENGALRQATWSEALHRAADILSTPGPDHIGIIGGAQLTNEGAFAFERLARQVLHTENIDAQYGDGLDGALVASLRRASINDMATAKVIVTMTGDLRQELPVLYLRLREAVKKGAALVEIAATSSALRPLASVTLPARPGESHLVARALAGDDAAVTALRSHPQGIAFTDAELARARELVGDATDVVFVVGRANVAESQQIADAAVATLRDAWENARFLPALRRANVQGALDMGLAPGLRPGRSSALAQTREGILAGATSGRSTLEQLADAASGDTTALLLLGGTLTSNFADAELANAALSRAKVVVVTGHGGADLAHADVVLPASVNHERAGTVTNIEGRVSALAPKVNAPGSAWNDVAIAAELAEVLGVPLGLGGIEETAAVIEATTGYPTRSVLEDASIEGLLVDRPDEVAHRGVLDPMAFPGIRSAELVGLAPRAGSVKSAPAPERASAARVSAADVPAPEAPAVAPADAYALRVAVTRHLYDLGAQVGAAAALGALVQNVALRANPYDLDRMGAVTGDVVRVKSAKGATELPVIADAAVVRGTAEIALNTMGAAAALATIIDAADLVTEIRLESR